MRSTFKHGKILIQKHSIGNISLHIMHFILNLHNWHYSFKHLIINLKTYRILVSYKSTMGTTKTKNVLKANKSKENKYL